MDVCCCAGGGLVCSCDVEERDVVADGVGDAVDAEVEDADGFGWAGCGLVHGVDDLVAAGHYVEGGCELEGRSWAVLCSC